MIRFQVGIVRYAAVARQLARELACEVIPECRIGHGRIYITFRNLGGVGWPLGQQGDYAQRVAAVVRGILESDHRRTIQRRTRSAVVVVFEDRALVHGCSAVGRWECVVPAPQKLASSTLW
ncbi:MAG: hypothetical protein ABJE47_16250 [bacterium]